MVSSEFEVKNEGKEKQAVEPIRLPTIEEIRGQDIWNHCAVRSVVSGVMVGGLGLFMGLFLGALDNPLMHEEMTAKQQFIYTAKQMGRRSWGSAKAFALMGLTFSAAECIVEKARAKHDMTNTVVAGCVTGGTMFARGSIHNRTLLFNSIEENPLCDKLVAYPLPSILCSLAGCHQFWPVHTRHGIPN